MTVVSSVLLVFPFPFLGAGPFLPPFVVAVVVVGILAVVSINTAVDDSIVTDSDEELLEPIFEDEAVDDVTIISLSFSLKAKSSLLRDRTVVVVVLLLLTVVDEGIGTASRARLVAPATVFALTDSFYGGKKDTDTEKAKEKTYVRVPVLMIAVVGKKVQTENIFSTYTHSYGYLPFLPVYASYPMILGYSYWML